MSIQQSINQMLYTAGVGSNLFAQTPLGKKIAKEKTLKQKLKTAENKYEIASSEAEFHPDPDVSAKVSERFSSEIADIRGQMYENNPTFKAYQSYARAVEEAQAMKGGFSDRIFYLSGKERQEIKKAKEQAQEVQE